MQLFANSKVCQKPGLSIPTICGKIKTKLIHDLEALFAQDYWLVKDLVVTIFVLQA